MPRYFKLVCLSQDRDEYVAEFFEGRARYGWSGPGNDLRQLKVKEGPWTATDRLVWSRTKFLLERVRPGDRIVVQLEQPIRTFLIGEVTGGYDFTPGDRPDFNHVLYVTPLTPAPIPVNSRSVSEALKYNLSKRGNYYQIYPTAATEELDRLVAEVGQGNIETALRKDEDTLDLTLQNVKTAVAREISERWRNHSFERFCAKLCGAIEHVEVSEQVDSGEGWDLLIRLRDPLTGEVYKDDVPVQCKNYTGAVTSHKPIDDLERCIEASGNDLAYLFILGELTDAFKDALKEREVVLSARRGCPISLRVVDGQRIAELYALHLARLGPDEVAGST